MARRIIATITVCATLVLLALGAASSALAATNRAAGQLNQDFGGAQARGLSYKVPAASDAGITCPTVGSTTLYWEASLAVGDSVYVGGGVRCAQGVDYGYNQIVIAKYTAGTLDTSFDSDGYRFIDLPSVNAGLRTVAGITLALNGELVVYGQLDDQEYMFGDFPNQVSHAYFLRIAANGTDSIAGTWGNTLGNSYTTGTTLHLSAIQDVISEQTNTYPSSGTTFASGAVTYNDSGTERWAVTGNSWRGNGGQYGWLATLTSTGSVNTAIHGHSDIPGFSIFVADKNSVEDATPYLCAYSQSIYGLVYDSFTSKIFVQSDCVDDDSYSQAAQFLIALDASNQRIDTTFGDQGFLPMMGTQVYDRDHVPTTLISTPWATIPAPSVTGVKSYTSGSATRLVFAGRSGAKAWAATYDATNRTLLGESAMTVASGTDKYRIYGAGVSSSGQAYLFGDYTFGDYTIGNYSWSPPGTDGLVLHFDSTTNTFDSSWATTGVGKYGSCAYESFSTVSVASTSGVFAFGLGSAISSGVIDSTFSTVSARIFSSAGSQTTTSGVGPVWTDSTFADGVTNVAYSDSVTASGSPTYFKVNGNIPSGLTFNSTTGTLSGTPTATASARMLGICAGNEWGITNMSDSITVTSTPPGPVAPSFANASYTKSIKVGTALSWVAAAATPGSATPVTYSYSGTLPTGVSFTAGTNTFAGTPSASGTFTGTLTATTTAGSGTTSITITVTPGDSPSFGSASYSTSTTVGTDLGWVPATATPGDATPVTYSYAGILPAGVSFDAAAHKFVGVSREAGSFTGTLTATTTIGSATATIAITVGAGLDGVAPGRPSWYTDTHIVGLTKGSPIDYRIERTGNFLPTCAVTAGELPIGLTLNATECVIMGTPRFAGDYSFTVTATNTTGTFDFDFSGTAGGTDVLELVLELSASVGELLADSPVTMSGSGLMPNSDWRAEIHSDPVVFANGVANVSGNFYSLGQLPADILPGVHQVILFGTDPSGNQIQRTTFVTVGPSGAIEGISESNPDVTGESADGQLPNTGTDGSAVALWFWVSMSLIALGLVAVRRTHRSS